MKTLFRARSVIIVVLVMLQTVSCKKEKSPASMYSIPANLKMISSGYATGASTKVEIYAASDLFVGYNQLYIALYDSISNARITNARVSLTALVNAHGTSQSGPVENPASDDANNGLFVAAAIFTQVSTTWNLSVQLQGLSSQKSGTSNCVVNVVQLSPALAYSVIEPNDSTNIFVSLVQPINPQLGVNTFELAIYHQISPTSFVPASGYSISINPTMPSMSGMNSPNNVNPTYVSNGHYVGKVDFIMSGAWQIGINLVNNGVVADSSHYFALTL